MDIITTITSAEEEAEGIIPTIITRMAVEGMRTTKSQRRNTIILTSTITR